MPSKPTKDTLRLSALADQLGYLDRHNLGTIRNGLPAPSGGTPLGTTSAIKLPLNVAARVIAAGHLDRYLSGLCAPSAGPTHSHHRGDNSVISTRLADKATDWPAILDGARFFASQTDIQHLLPPIASPVFEREVRAVLDLRQMAVLLAEDGTGNVLGGLGLFIVPYTWNRDLLSAQEVFWWTRPGCDPRAATRLLRDAVAYAKAAGVTVLAFSKLATSPEAVDAVYRRLGLRPAQTNYVGLVT